MVNLPEKVKRFTTEFVEALGEFVGKQKNIARANGVSKDEINAVITEAFYLLGKGHNEFKKKAKLK